MISDPLGIMRLAIPMLAPEVRSCLLEKNGMFDMIYTVIYTGVDGIPTE